MKYYEKSLFLGDVHIPFEDKNSIRIAFDFAEYFEPDVVFLIGDVIDFYSISSFDKEPSRINSLQEDINKATDFLQELRNTCPQSKIFYLEGNHEDRLRRYMWKHPEISSLDALSIQNLLSLKEFDIKYKEASENVMFHNFLIEHGEIVSKHSGYTAKNQFDRCGVSGISGHTHRLGSHYHTNVTGDYVWLENGCLCSRQPCYATKVNWQNGFSLGYYKKGGNRFSVEQVCITHNKAVYAGMEFK